MERDKIIYKEMVRDNSSHEAWHGTGNKVLLIYLLVGIVVDTEEKSAFAVVDCSMDFVLVVD